MSRRHPFITMHTGLRYHETRPDRSWCDRTVVFPDGSVTWLPDCADADPFDGDDIPNLTSASPTMTSTSDPDFPDYDPTGSDQVPHPQIHYYHHVAMKQSSVVLSSAGLAIALLVVTSINSLLPARVPEGYRKHISPSCNSSQRK